MEDCQTIGNNFPDGMIIYNDDDNNDSSMIHNTNTSDNIDSNRFIQNSK